MKTKTISIILKTIGIIGVYKFAISTPSGDFTHTEIRFISGFFTLLLLIGIGIDIFQYFKYKKNKTP